MNAPLTNRRMVTVLGLAMMLGCADDLGDPALWDAPLRAATAEATRLEVRDAVDDRLLFALDDADAIAELLDRIEVDPTHFATCRCGGDYALVFSGRVDTRITLHHMAHLRLGNGEWPADGLLTAQSLAAFTDWFAAHGFERFELVRLAHPDSAPTRAWHRILRHWPETGRATIAAVDSDTLDTEVGFQAFAAQLAAEMGPVEMAVASMRALGRSSRALWQVEPLEIPAWAAFAAVDSQIFAEALARIVDDPLALIGAARVSFDADWLGDDPFDVDFDSDLLDTLPDRDRWMATMAAAVFTHGLARDRTALLSALHRHGGPRCFALLAQVAPEALMSLVP